MGAESGGDEKDERGRVRGMREREMGLSVREVGFCKSPRGDE